MLSPVLLACALAVRLEGGPGIIFHQERVGRDGRTFECLKFRSMKPATHHGVGDAMEHRHGQARRARRAR